MSTVRFFAYLGFSALFFGILALLLPVDLCAGLFAGSLLPALCLWLNLPIDFSTVQMDYYHVGTRIPWNGEGDFYAVRRDE